MIRNFLIKASYLGLFLALQSCYGGKSAWNFKVLSPKNGDTLEKTDSNTTSVSGIIYLEQVELSEKEKNKLQKKLKKMSKRSKASWIKKFKKSYGKSTAEILKGKRAKKLSLSCNGKDAYIRKFGKFGFWKAKDIELSSGENLVKCVLEAEGQVISKTVKVNYEVEEENQAPVASLSISILDSEQNLYRLNGTSFDTDGEIVSGNYKILFPDTSVIELSGLGFKDINLNIPGQYKVEYSVIDNEGLQSNIANSSISVENKAPLSLLTFTNTENRFVFDASTSSDSDGVISNYTLLLTSPSSIVEEINSNNPVIEHVFNQNGLWSFQLKVTDNIGATTLSDLLTVDINFTILPPDPGEEGKITIAGIDNNNNGVRDDVERHIASLNTSEINKDLLMNLANKLQAGIKLGGSPAASIDNSYSLIDQGYCIRSYIATSEASDFTEDIYILQYNTKIRLTEYFKTRNHFSGQSVVLNPNESEYREYCD